MGYVVNVIITNRPALNHYSELALSRNLPPNIFDFHSSQDRGNGETTTRNICLRDA